MTLDDVSRVERTLGVVLPRDYRDFLMRHASLLEAAQATLSYYAVLWTLADDIIRGNMEARSHAAYMTICDEEENESPWPATNLVVGTNGGGDYWFLALQESPARLYFWQHESHEATEYAPSLEAYVAKVRADLQEPDVPPWQRG